MLGTLAAANGRHQDAGIGGHQPKALPARHHAGALGMGEHLVVQGRKWRHVQMRPRLVKRAVADTAHHGCGVAHGAKHRIQQALLRRCAHAKQRGNQCGQRQLAPAREGAGEVGLPCGLREGVRVQGLGELQQQRLDRRTGLSSYCEMNSESAMILTTYGLVELKFAALGCGHAATRPTPGAADRRSGHLWEIGGGAK